MTDSGIDEAAAFAAVERIRGISWRRDPARLPSQIVLMREYLRRSALAAETLGGAADWPWNDMAAVLTLPGVDRRCLPGYVFLDPAPEYPGPEADPLEAEVIALNGRVNTASTIKSAYAWPSCLWYIRWEAIKQNLAVRPLNLPDLYDPLITFYERGGWFRPEQGYLDLDGYNLSRLSCRVMAEQMPPVSLSPAALDQLDEEGKSR